MHFATTNALLCFNQPSPPVACVSNLISRFLRSTVTRPAQGQLPFKVIPYKWRRTTGLTSLDTVTPIPAATQEELKAFAQGERNPMFRKLFAAATWRIPPWTTQSWFLWWSFPVQPALFLVKMGLWFEMAPQPLKSRWLCASLRMHLFLRNRKGIFQGDEWAHSWRAGWGHWRMHWKSCVT